MKSATTSNEEKEGDWQGDRRAKRYLPVTPHPTPDLTPTIYQTLPLKKVEREESKMLPSKKGSQSTLTHPQLIETPNGLGKCISQDALSVKDLGWERFFKEKQERGDFVDLGGVDHPGCRLPRHYIHKGATVFF